MAEPFSAIQADFLEFTSRIVWCTTTTVDGQGRPRSRVLHPIFRVDGGRPVGWVLTGKTPVKTAHLAANPYVACSYWSPDQNVVYVDCIASWVEDEADKQRIWDVFLHTPPPLGYGERGLSGYSPEGPRAPLFTPMRLDPWRIQVLRFEGWTGNHVPRMWRANDEGETASD